MTTPRTIECALPTGRRQSRRPARQARVAVTPGRVPRVSRLLALALRLDRLVRVGEIADYATLARLGHVSRARVSQILVRADFGNPRGCPGPFLCHPFGRTGSG